MKVVGWSGLVVRLHRFEIIAVGIALALWIAVALVCAWQINDVVERYPGCFRLSAPGSGRLRSRRTRNVRLGSHRDYPYVVNDSGAAVSWHHLWSADRRSRT